MNLLMLALWVLAGAAAAFYWLRSHCNHIVCRGPQCVVFKTTLIVLFLFMWPIVFPIAAWICRDDDRGSE